MADTLSGLVAFIKDGQVREIRDLGPNPVGVRPGAVLPVVTSPRPSFDPATQIVEGPIYTIDGDHVTQSWNLRDLTAQEIEARKDAQVDAAFQKLLFDVNFDQENRLRALEGKPAITKAQYRNALKAAL